MGDSSSRLRDRTLVGQTVDGHELVRALAAGGMGEVYLARHLRLGMMRAIKVIRENQRDEHAAERFTREAQVLSQLQHNSIVQIIEFGELSNGWPFLLMEYVDGPNLDQVVEGRGPFALGDALVVLEQIASALAYAHRKEVVHRDLKPSNVLLRGGELQQVKLIDFGLAHTLSTETLKRLTAEGQVVGSPLYMAPEQAEGSLEVTPAVDVYALAGVAYVLLSGRAPFPKASVIEAIVAHATETPERLSARCPGIPRAFDDLMFAALAKPPAARPTIDALVGELGRLARAARLQPMDASSADSDLARAATMNVAVATRQAESELARALDTPASADGMSEPLLNQLVSLVGDIAEALSAHEPELARLLGDARRTAGDLTDLEMEIAVIDAEELDAAGAARAELDRKRTGLTARASALRVQALANQRALTARVDRMRSHASSQIQHLFAEVDEVMGQLRAVSRS